MLRVWVKPVRDELHVRVDPLAFLGGIAFHAYGAVPFVAVEQGHDGEGDGGDTGHAAESLGELPVELQAALGLVSVERGVDGEGQEVAGLEAGMDALQVLEALDEESGGDQQEQR